jgi:hypothetical protein
MVALVPAAASWAAKIPTTLPELLTFYAADAAQPFDAERGKTFWHRKRPADDGKDRSCTACHGEDLTKSGKHIKSGKVIDPMAPSANKERFTDRKKVEKWFKRNCKWTLGRECTAQEKGDVLKYLSLQ